jgi:hypothetical protein
MNPIRNVVPTETTRLRGRATRLAQLSALFAAVLFGAISCGDSGATDPLIWAGVNVAPDSLKHPAVPPGSEPAPSALLSASAAASAAAAPSMTASSIPFAPAPGPFKSGGFPANDDFTWGGSVGFDIGFDFMFYGVTHSKFWIGSNGVILFRRDSQQHRS